MPEDPELVASGCDNGGSEMTDDQKAIMLRLARNEPNYDFASIRREARGIFS